VSASRTRRVFSSALVAGACAALALAGCSAGQVTQTARQVAAVAGANITVGTIALRDLMIEYNGPEGYRAGEDAPLVVRIFNDGVAPLTLTGVTSEVAESVTVVGGPGATVSPLPTATATGSPSPAASPSPAESPSPGGSPSPGESPSPAASPTPAPAPVQTPVAIQIPPQSYVLLVPGQGRYLQLNRLKEALVPGASAAVTFTFDNGTSVPVRVPLAPPSTEVPRGTPVVPPGEEGHD
jgi:copper(I)-binding protein